ncbi:MAG: zinc-ribbon domain-containing protein [Geothrix sp.]|uniref:zinc-ribbon domain-containing protein n=1 Tax=Geothrix sp. TaxID=1962974 RepID=UPI0017993CFD|nr:zinc-ribbon domain-containing protein [Geothrix sp.]NWJ41834.1 zinc-ribbon domain-containing protein [Geothrix sp.]WIL20190.1 MAG: zinc-ribbon domain-containing protein [Geothrix sp.]
MAEAIHCPSCTTRYRLRPERLKPVIRRAKCLSCGGVFPVGDVVQRLLALPVEPVAAEPMPEVIESVHLDEPPPAEALPPSLTLGDLDVADEEILEKTLVAVPESLPEAKAEPASTFPPEITETTLSGYTSARDAIEKLFGNAPTASSLKVGQDPHAMDMEAALSALDTTLGPTPANPPSAGTETLGDSPTAAGLTEEDLAGPSSSTMRLSQEDMQAIIAAASAPAESTVALRASDLATTPAPYRDPAATAPVPRSFAPLPESPDTGAELLRLKIGEDIYGGLTMPQLMAWVEEGRILENHLVARQHSENWLEAHKVPGLRPVFERLRRERSSGAPSLDSGIGDSSSKKSLFGGLFGKS